MQQIPTMEKGPPRPGHLVQVTAPEWRGTQIYHTLYLPSNWEKGKKYPVIVEYPGNCAGSVCTGRVEDCKLGFYASGGQTAIVMALPFVNAEEGKNQLTWWGDVEATVRYCKLAVQQTCEEHGGDASKVLLTGFSRGAIACGYIGLHDDAIAGLWAGLIPYAHFDGGTFTPEGAQTRLARIKNRPVLIIYGEHDKQGKANSLVGGKILENQGGHLTFLQIPGTGHTDTWIEKQSPQRDVVRQWIQQVIGRGDQ